MRRSLLALLMLVPLSVRAQKLATLGDPQITPANASKTATIAVRAPIAPVIDGKDADPIWEEAQTIDGFTQFEPKMGAEATFRTVAKVAYDDRYMYVFVRAYDPHPDSIVGLLSRRDVRTESDQIKVMIDSYHDRRTGYEFAVNPRGVKRDYYTFNDSEEDESWDAVWDVATSVDSQGWTAEFRIPFSQLRFPHADEHTFGIMIWREVSRLAERDSWPLFRHDRQGIASQFGEVSGIRGVGEPRRLELLPYVVAKNTTEGLGPYTRDQQLTGGADIKYGLTSNVTLDATVNPDFGQVEADPAVLNLSGFETFFHEKRPFFIEGTGIFRFDLQCQDQGCTGLFYSRRIGRTPQIFDDSANAQDPARIIGAAKITGRLNNGLSVGVLDAVTQKVRGTLGQTLEPGTNYFAGRLVKEFREGATTIGAMATAVNRQIDAFSGDSIRTNGYTGGVDFRHEFDQRKYRLNGFASFSYVDGTDSAIAVTQASSTHWFQRPDDGTKYDPSRTSLSGDGEKINFEKIGGGVVRFSTTYLRFSPGFEANDIGFVQRAGIQSWANWFGLQFQQPTSLYRQLFVNVNEWQRYNTVSLNVADRTDIGTNVSAHMQLPSSWWLHFGSSLNEFVPVYQDDKSRGGPNVRRSPWADINFGVEGDKRMTVSPSLFMYAFRGSIGRSHGWGMDPSVVIRVKGNAALTLAPHYDLNIDAHQWIDNFPHGSDTSYTFAQLHQETIWLTVRLDYIFSPNLSLQVYGQPFVSSGKYTGWDELNEPRAEDYNARWKPYASPDGTEVSAYNFNDYEFNSNVVFRWEYRPGSTIFLVWNQGRSEYDEGSEFGGFNVHDNMQGLWSQHPNNTFLIKMSYWFSP